MQLSCLNQFAKVISHHIPMLLDVGHEAQLFKSLQTLYYFKCNGAAIEKKPSKIKLAAIGSKK